MNANTIPAELFEAARQGDPAALTRLLEQTRPDIRRYARAACRTSQDAEDAVQETLWRFARHIGALRSLFAVPRWLFTVVRRECLRLARQAGWVASEADEAALAALATRSEPELRLDVAAAFEALPEHLREVALMRDIREMTLDEMAEALGLTRETVKARLHRARVLLRDHLTR